MRESSSAVSAACADDADGVSNATLPLPSAQVGLRSHQKEAIGLGVGTHSGAIGNNHDASREENRHNENVWSTLPLHTFHRPRKHRRHFLSVICNCLVLNSPRGLSRPRHFPGPSDVHENSALRTRGGQHRLHFLHAMFNCRLLNSSRGKSPPPTRPRG